MFRGEFTCGFLRAPSIKIAWRFYRGTARGWSVHYGGALDEGKEKGRERPWCCSLQNTKILVFEIVREPLLPLEAPKFIWPRTETCFFSYLVVFRNHYEKKVSWGKLSVVRCRDAWKRGVSWSENSVSVWTLSVVN